MQEDPMKIELKKAIYYNASFILRKEYFGGILFNLKNGRSIQLNKSAYYIWSCLGAAPIKSLIFDKTIIYSDIIDFIQTCIEEKLLTYNVTNCKVYSAKNLIYGNYISAPIEGYLYLTNRCNQNCSFCYAKLGDYDKKLNADQWKIIIDEFEKLGVCTLGFLGGEPLMERELLLELLDYSDGKMWRTITTNGTARGGINEELAERFSRYSSLEFNVSIESDNAKKHDSIVNFRGAYELAMKSIKNLVKRKINVTVKIVVTQNNYNEIYSLVKKCKELGANGVYLLDYMPAFSDSLESYKNIRVDNCTYWNIIKDCELLADESFYVLKNTRYRFLQAQRQLEEKENLLYYATKCSAGNINLDIMPNGDAYSCPITVGQREYLLGNALSNSISDIWNSPSLDVFRKREKTKLRSSTCIECKNNELCIGGCPIVSEIFTGSTYGGDIRCPRLTQ